MEPLTLLIAATLGMTPTICDFPIRSVSKPPRTEWRGRYENDAYGYSVVIPKGFVGYSGPDGYP